MKVKLKDNAPWPFLKIKKGFVLSKDSFSEELTDPDVIKQIDNLKRIVEVEEDSSKKKRVLKEDEYSESKLKTMLKKDIIALLIKRKFDLKDLKGLTKLELIEAYFIDKV